MGIDIIFSEKVIYWDGDAFPMKVYSSFQYLESVNACYITETEDPILQKAEEQQKSILDHNYSKIEIKEIIHKLKISSSSNNKLYWMLNKFPILFGDGLVKMDCEPIHFDLKAYFRPTKQRYYNIPKAFKGVTKYEVKWMCDIGVLEKLNHCTNYPWEEPTFVPQNDNEDVWVLTDLREVNKLIDQKTFSLVRINDLLQTIEKLKSATA